MSNHTTSEQRAFASSATATSTANDQQQQQQRQQQRRPLQVFVLAGQSNMVGMGSIEHMDLLVSSSNGTDSNIFRETLLSKTNQSSNDNNDSPPVYQERDDVIIQYDENHGKLTISRTAGFAGKNSFGPEVMFGWTVGDALAPSRKPRRNEDDDPTEPPPTIVWLIKTAWGGQSLAVDFRPPAAGEGTYAGVHPAQYGWLYRTMIATIQTALENIAQVVPQYDASVGYELAGLVWFQGWNDMLNWDTVTEYGPNLEKFIRDVRLDLNAPPTMPIGE